MRSYLAGQRLFAWRSTTSQRRATTTTISSWDGKKASAKLQRFGLNFELDFYAVQDLTLIVRRSAGLLGVQLDADAAEEIARRARGTPRIANRLLRRVRDFAQVEHIERVGVTLVTEALELEGVDESGLDDLDRRYLKTLIGHYQGRPAGVAALAAAMQQEMDTLEDVVEPYLLYEGFLLRTPNGRQATPRAYAHLRLRPPGHASAQQPLPLDGENQ